MTVDTIRMPTDSQEDLKTSTLVNESRVVHHGKFGSRCR
jgi:hypothetical protein